MSQVSMGSGSVGTRLVGRYDRLAGHVRGFVTITCALICYRRLTKIAK